MRHKAPPTGIAMRYHSPMPPARKKPTRAPARRTKRAPARRTKRAPARRAPVRPAARRPARQAPARPAPRLQYLVFTWAPEEVLEEWNEWHTNVHIPNVLKTPQMRAARKYRLAQAALPGDWPFQYVTIYELNSMADFEAYRSGPGIALRKEHDDRWGDVVRIARILIREDQRTL